MGDLRRLLMPLRVLILTTLFAQACNSPAQYTNSASSDELGVDAFATGFVFSGDVESYDWDCSDGQTGSTYDFDQRYVTEISVKVNANTTPDTQLKVTLRRKGTDSAEVLTGSAFSGVTFDKKDLTSINVWAEDKSGVQSNLYLDCKVGSIGRKPVPSVAIPSFTPAPVATTWYPKGFSVWRDDSSVAWRWVPHRKLDCTYYSGSCWGIYVFTKDGCYTSLYAELTIFDRNNVQIDYANDLTSYVAPYQKVMLIFDTFNDNANTGRLTKLDCY